MLEGQSRDYHLTPTIQPATAKLDFVQRHLPTTPKSFIERHLQAGVHYNIA